MIEDKMSEIRYVEIFKSIQGEALNVGKLCTWLRTFSCSLQCRGFGQEDPSNPATWVEQRPNVDIKSFTDLKSVPTPNVGCDSDYSWSAKFKHLAMKKNSRELADEIRELTSTGSFDKIGHVFTGGEPLLQQDGIAEILEHWIDDGNFPAWVAFETNVTQTIKPKLERAILELKRLGVDVYFSMSPKLLHVSGEKPNKAIKIDEMQSYWELCPSSYLKFVLNEDERSWDQARDIVSRLKDAGCDPDVWVMPVGSVFDDQTSAAIGRIADKAIFEYEWNFSPRVHVLIWQDDQIGR
jgi:organic radical activating enzyme